MSGKLHHALIAAGVEPDAAREACEEVAASDRRLARIEVLMAANTTVLGVLAPLIAGILWLVWDTNQVVQVLRSALAG